MSVELPNDVGLMDGDTALPRDNGELVFEAPWQARALAVAVALTEKLDVPWDEFRSRLMKAVEDDPHRPYYDSWATALESLVLDLDLATPSVLEAAMPAERPTL